MLLLDRVTAGYDGVPVLSDFSASFTAGKFCAVLGPNGCGKSTLLKTIMHFLPFSGTVKLDGESLHPLTPKERARKIAYLAQSKAVPAMTVEELVLHGRFPHLGYPRFYKESDRSIAHDAMEKMHILPYRHLPLATLSGGMRQNAYIAMALAQNADFILLDEPATYLDVKNRYHLMQTIRTLTKAGKGVIGVFHDLPLCMEYADSLLLIKDGKPAVHDTPLHVYLSGCIPSVFGINLGRTVSGTRTVYYYESPTVTL